MPANDIRVSKNDEQQIRDLFERLADSWARGDAHAYGSEFTPNCDYVAFDGTWYRRPGEPAAHLAHLFGTVLKDSRLVGELESVRFVTSDVAIAHYTGSVAYPWQQQVKQRRQSRQTLVLVRQGAEWMATAFHNTRVRPLKQEGFGFRLATRFIRWRAARARRKNLRR